MRPRDGELQPSRAIGSPGIAQDPGAAVLYAEHDEAASAAGVGQTVLTVAEAIAMALARPQIVVLTLICLALSVTSFRFLRGLVSRERSWAYVDPL